MKIGIHQPHYFPWLGYLDKMAKVDVFILLDEVQIEKGSNMYRNKLCTWQGQEKYVTVAYEKKGCLNIPFNRIAVDNSVEWQERQINFICNNYKKTPYFGEIYEHIEPILRKRYTSLCEVSMDTVLLEKKLFDIKTKIVMQSELSYDKTLIRNELLINLIKSVAGDYYLSGNGARKYMDISAFEDEGIHVEYQSFTYPAYSQAHEFVPNLSALDMLFNCGIEGAREIFWGNMKEYD